MIITDPLLDFDYICKDKSDSVLFKFTKPELIKTVLINDKPYEGECNGYYTIIKDNDNIYKMYYRANKCPIICSHESSAPYNLLCIALSLDGIDFAKPELNFVTDNSNKTNIILQDNCCGNISPIY